MNYSIDSNGYYGEFGGAYIPEILHRCVSQLQEACRTILPSDDFKREFEDLLRHYVGRPSPLYHARRLSEKYSCKVYLKREDLNHTGAHKINNAVGQMLLARRMGKRRIIAETGAGQHGVAAATVCALAGMECMVFMGKTDIERQHVNVEKMKMLGAQVVSVTSGNATLKDATNEAIRYWCCHPDDTYYLIGSTVGPHPYPQLVAHLQSVIGEEIARQLTELEGREYPDHLVACVGGGSNAAGTLLDGQVTEPYSISAGLDYPGIGPLHAHLAATKRADVLAVNDDEALRAAYELTRLEGIIPALESAHALAVLPRLQTKTDDVVVITVSGRGDKDMDTYLKHQNEYNL